MKTNSKKLLSVLVAVMMALGLMAPALASEGTTTNTGTEVQITKKLLIGEGIAIPNETFTFSFASTNTAEVSVLGDVGGYLDPEKDNVGVTYPNLNNLIDVSKRRVVFSSAMRSQDGATDTELTYLTDTIDLNDSNIQWPISGLYIYSVKEVAGENTKITYDDQTYYLKVYVKNRTNPTTGQEETYVSYVGVMGKNPSTAEGAAQWIKVNAAPTTDHEEVIDGVDDYKGNGFCFTNTYRSMVDKHLINSNDSSDTPVSEGSAYSASAFKLLKQVQGDFASPNDAFAFKVSYHLPATYDANANGPITGKVNAITAKMKFGVDVPEGTADDAMVNVTVLDETEYEVWLRDEMYFTIDELPAGTKINVTELAFTDRPYTPSYVGKWGLDSATQRSGNSGRGTDLTSSTIVVGEDGAYIHYTNTINDSDVTVTGIVISNLPYILMVGIALGGIGFFTLSKKRRHG